MTVLGLDIGGASLKAATSSGWARSERFPLWKQPDRLAEALAELCDGVEFDRLAITMTGELSDGFETKEQGVREILDAVRCGLGDAKPLGVWQTSGQFVSVEEAMADPWRTASANWLALATLVARQVDVNHTLWIDIGSTTTDLIPLDQGCPVPVGRTDPERLASGELVYQGVRRTPVCAVLPEVTIAGVRYRTMAELFATSLDAYLVNGQIAEDPSSRDTADGRAETKPYAHDRLSRMIGSDRTKFTRAHAAEMAEQIQDAQLALISAAATSVVQQGGHAVETVVVSGEGEFLAQQVCQSHPQLGQVPVVSWSQLHSAEISRAACAYAVAKLLEEQDGRTTSP